MGWRRIAFLLVVAAVLLTGCSSSRDDDVEQVAERFHAAIEQQDGAAACGLLSQEAQRTLSAAGDTCDVAVLDSGVPSEGRVVKVRVYDTAAQVRYDEDVVFLADFPEGWRITAAGCRPRPSQPYECDIEGG
jgi:hypothetical protein